MSFGNGSQNRNGKSVAGAGSPAPASAIEIIPVESKRKPGYILTYYALFGFDTRQPVVASSPKEAVDSAALDFARIEAVIDTQMRESGAAGGAIFAEDIPLVHAVDENGLEFWCGPDGRPLEYQGLPGDLLIEAFEKIGKLVEGTSIEEYNDAYQDLAEFYTSNQRREEANDAQK
jgi:hypothetical protein